MNGTSYTQDGREMAVETVLGKDVLLLTEFSGEESISSLFSFQLTMLSKRDDITAEELVGSEMTVTVRRSDGQYRYFHGRVRILTAGGLLIAATFREYYAEIVPDLWFLTRTADCRIFQQMTVKAILEDVLTKFGVNKIKIDIQTNLPELNFCVQYRETAFNFISRLMERYGIFYFFKHEDGNHTLNIVDKNAGCAVSDDSNIPFEAGTLADLHVDHWVHSYEFRSPKYVQTDLDFTHAHEGGPMKVEENTLLKFPAAPSTKFEIYDYPGGYETNQVGKNLTQTRMKQEEAPHDIIEGAGNCMGFYAGAKFKLSEHIFEKEAEGFYILTAVSHYASDNSYIGGDGGSYKTYSNSFRCIPDDEKHPYQPQRKTIKPRISGTQTAIVCGKAGEEIWCDNYGRVKVQFFWDRVGENNENSSCWIRVGQIWAGAGWGAYFVPRIGHEVIVEFLEGDPDRPIITGSVYNYDNNAPYKPEAGEGGGPVTISTIRSLSSPGGAVGANYNELRFEDKKDEEEIFMQAEKNLKITVKNDRETVIGEETADPGDDKLIVQNDQNIEIRNDQTIEIANDQTVNIGNDQTIDVINEITINAGSKITLTTGASSITMSSDGTIDIEGVTVTVKGSGTADVESPSTTIKGSMMVTIEGGIVKIN